MSRFSALSLDDDEEETGETILYTSRAAKAASAKAASAELAASECAPAGARGSSRNSCHEGDERPQPAADAPAPERHGPAPKKLGSGALLWIDLEMTGLDATTDHILEVAAVLTDGQLGRMIEGPEIVVSQPESVIEGMNEWCKEHHGASGLTTRVRESTTTLAMAEEQLLRFVQQHTIAQCVNLAGNAVYKDKEFLERYMPSLMEHVSWRLVDVSTINELAHRWYPSALRRAPRKRGGHRAKADILESIEELRFYRRALFRQSAVTAPSGKRA